MYEAIAMVVVAVITIGGSVFTNRQARKTANSTATTTVQGQVDAARIAAEEHAFERAREGYEAAINRRDLEIGELERDLVACRTELSRTRERVTVLEGQVHDLTIELETAKRALRLRYPDE